MIEKTIKTTTLSGTDETTDNLAWWLTRSVGERIAAVEYLRNQYVAGEQGIQRVVRITQLDQG